MTLLMRALSSSSRVSGLHAPGSSSVPVVAPVVAPAVSLASAALHSAAVEVGLAADLVLVLREHVRAYHVASLQVAAAVEAGGVVGAAGAVVDRGRGIRTQRAWSRAAARCVR